VVVDRPGRDEQPLCDLGVHRSISQQVQDLDLAKARRPALLV
jgi:hypothetical protein